MAASSPAIVASAVGPLSIGLSSVRSASSAAIFSRRFLAMWSSTPLSRSVRPHGLHVRDLQAPVIGHGHGRAVAEQLRELGDGLALRIGRHRLVPGLLHGMQNGGPVHARHENRRRSASSSSCLRVPRRLCADDWSGALTRYTSRSSASSVDEAHPSRCARIRPLRRSPRRVPRGCRCARRGPWWGPASGSACRCPWRRMASRAAPRRRASRRWRPADRA